MANHREQALEREKHQANNCQKASVTTRNNTTKESRRRNSSTVEDKENSQTVTPAYQRKGSGTANTNAYAATKPKSRESRREREDAGTRTRKPSSNRRSSSRTRGSARAKSRPRAESTSKRKGSVPRRTNSHEKKPSRRESSATARNEKAAATSAMRRTKSYENIYGSESHKKGNSGGKNWSASTRQAAPLLVDERGLPMTSVGCAAVASLRTSCTSPNNVDTNNFDALYARKLQQELSRSPTKRPVASLEKRKSCSDLYDPREEEVPTTAAVLEEDRKMPALKKRSRSKSCKRRNNNGKEANNNNPVVLVPLNPEESIQRDGLLSPRLNRSDCTGDAKKFMQRLRSVLKESPPVASSPSRRSQGKEPLFSSILTDKEMIDLVITMKQVQFAFGQNGKPTKVDAGFHFCRCSNVKRIQQQPGLWSRIQERGVSKSQDGDGIFTFDNPLSSQGVGDADDIWMIVARLQGNTSPFLSNSNSTKARRKWNGDIDSLVRHEDGVVVLKTSTQFFPLLQFRSSLLLSDVTGTDVKGSRTNGILQQIQLMQEKLQALLDDFFPPDKKARSSALGPSSASPATATDNMRGTPNQEENMKSDPPEQQIAVEEGKKPSRVEPPLSFADRVSTISNPAAWEVASEMQNVVEEHAIAARVTGGGLDDHTFTVQSAVTMEEMAVLAENMFRTQKLFLESNRSPYVEIGYHYCRGQNLKKMQQKPGFWSNVQSRGVSRSEDGDGIYTFNNPLGARNRPNRGGFFDVRQSISHDDDVWLLVARLQGERQPAPTDQSNMDTSRRWDDSIDAMVVGHLQSDEVVVLRTSAQFFPLLQFPASCINSSSENHRDEIAQELQMIHHRLQSILDTSFNQEHGDDSHGFDGLRLSKVEEELLEYNAPETLDVVKSICSSSQQIYKVLSHNKKAMNDDCSICLDSLRRTSHQQVVRLKNCKHEFHRACLHEAMDHFDLCPICNQAVAPQAPPSCLHGLSPSGVMMTSTSSHLFCEGCWAPAGSLVLSYFLPNGIQKIYHATPGVSFFSSDWKAYLPYNEQGVKLLRRLQYAFLHGLLFTVEAGFEFPRAGHTNWSAIPHKTSPRATAGAGDGDGGYPDETYFARCNHELTRCGVPEPAICERFVLFRENELPLNAVEPAPESTALDQKPPASLRRSELEECSRILTGLKKHQCGWMFCKTLPLLIGKVENPMDLTMIEERLAHDKYSSVEDFRRDVNMVFDSALAHHSKENPVHFMAKQLKKKFKKDCREGQ